MSRSAVTRNLSLTEELEKLEQSITLTLQEIDSNFSKAHRIVTTSILPLVEEYAKHSNDVWEGSKFWKQFFEASANVSLSGYEEAALEEDMSNTENTSTELETPVEHDEHTAGNADAAPEDDDLTFSVDSPTQVTGSQTTPRLSASASRTPDAREALARSTAAFRSPSPRKYTGNNARAAATATGAERQEDEPSTPRPQTNLDLQSSPFEPESAFQPSAQPQRTVANDPLMHRGVLDKNYRIQATPHTQRRVRQEKISTGAASAASKPTTATSTAQRGLWEDSPQSSPAMPAPQLRSDLFSPARPGLGVGAPASHRPTPLTPGVSVLTPARKSTGAGTTTSTGKRLFSPDKAMQQRQPPDTGRSGRASDFFSLDSDSDADELLSPPKTLQFHVPQSRLVQTPAHEASRRIVEDLLLTAGADATDEIEDGDGTTAAEEGQTGSPSLVRKAWEEDTF